MVESELEILRERQQETGLGKRNPFDSSLQATYEDQIPPDPEWEYEDS